MLTNRQQAQVYYGIDHKGNFYHVNYHLRVASRFAARFDNEHPAPALLSSQLTCFNTAVAAREGALDGIPGIGRFIMWAFSGTGPLWFIQLLWLLCAALLLIRALDHKDKFWNWCGNAGITTIILLGILFWAGEKTLIRNPRPESLDGLLNLYKPLFYLIPFLLGYFVFSHDAVQEKIKGAWIPLLVCAVISGAILIVTTYGQNNTSPEYLGSPLNCLYGWLACLAMMGWFQTKFDRTGKFASYMTRSSYGIYIVHYLVIVSLGYMMKMYTELPPWAMYTILAVAVFMLSPLLYETLRRIPFVRCAVFGESSHQRS